jgi:hypothetical protein
MGKKLRSFCLGGRFWLACGAFLSLACEKTKDPEITLQVGPEKIHRFGASSGFAHYYELPGQDDLLRIVLASYPIGCEEYEAPDPGEVFITVSLRVPAPKTIEPGKYTWRGLLVPDPDPEAEGESEEGTTEQEPSALPFVRLAEDARALPPGGGMTLTKFEPEKFGLVEGDFEFRDADAGQAANAALLGHFSVRLCHLGLDASRRAPAKLE